jgi:hypothetical protein
MVRMSEIMGDRRAKSPYGNAHVEFQLVHEIDPEATAKANGQPKYREKEILMVHSGREKTPVEVTDYHRSLYAEKYAAFKGGLEQPIEGTPLSEWAMIPRTAVLELAHFNVKTVEQLAGLSGDLKKKIGPLSSYCKSAKVWLESASSTQSEVTQLRAEIERESKARQSLEEQVVKLMQRIEATEGVKLFA